MGGPCGTPHFVFTSFIESLQAACKPCYNPKLPTTLLPPSRNMREHDWQAVMLNQWIGIAVVAVIIAVATVIGHYGARKRALAEAAETAPSHA